MNLNEIAPAAGAKKAPKRVGRGIGSGLGKTAGRGHKGQKARAGGGVRTGFEGGQQPLYRRLPKYGFQSRIGRLTAEVRLGELERVDGDVVSLESLKAANVIPARTVQAKIILSGSVTKAYVFQNVKLTKGAREAVESIGGRVEE